MDVYSRFQELKALVFDMDGVLTDGNLLASASGELLRVFNIKDGYALQLAVKKGLYVALLSGGTSAAAVKRFTGLGMQDIFTGVTDKAGHLREYLSGRGLDPAQVLYMGDDMPDLEAMKLAGLPACPADAVSEIQAVSLYISPYGGGKGCVRDVIERTLKMQGKWN